MMNDDIRTHLQSALDCLQAAAADPSVAPALLEPMSQIRRLLGAEVGPFNVEGLSLTLRTRVGADTGRILYQVIDDRRSSCTWLASPELAIQSYLLWRSAAIAKGIIAP